MDKLPDSEYIHCALKSVIEFFFRMSEEKYRVPEKLITSPMLMGKFQRSEAYHKLIRFIQKAFGV